MSQLFVCRRSDMGFHVSVPCRVCGDLHDYTSEECENFLTFGQGGADFEESQRLAKLYEEEVAAGDSTGFAPTPESDEHTTSTTDG